MGKPAFLAALALLVLLMGACVTTPTPSVPPTSTPFPLLSAGPTPGPSHTTTPSSGPTPPTPAAFYAPAELKYRLVSRFPGLFFCDPDFFPVAREGQERQNAIQQFPAIRADAAEFIAILKHLGLPDRDDYDDGDKLLIYREHKKLAFGLQMTAQGDVFHFSLRTGQGQGERIEGTITGPGEIAVLKREPSFNTCPICLARGTLVDTPGGQVPVEQLGAGMRVWTVDASGRRLAGEVIETGMTPVPSHFQVVRVTVADGRSVTASPGHPTVEGRVLGDYRAGVLLDGSVVVTAERIPYDGGATYDILPSGETGRYWANGILLESTLRGK